MTPEVAIVLAAAIPSAVGAAATVYVARLQRSLSGMQSKVDQTHHEVTVNGHTSETPTMRDRLSEVRQAVVDLDEKLNAHIDDSTNDRRNIWRAVWWAYRRSQEKREEEDE